MVLYYACQISRHAKKVVVHLAKSLVFGSLPSRAEEEEREREEGREGGAGGRGRVKDLR